jgi:AraC family transcriptional regulator
MLRFTVGVTLRKSETAVFSERSAWQQFGAGWLPLHGGVVASGVSFEWHDFKTYEPFDWGKSFHPDTIEVCLNLEGDGTVASSGAEMVFAPMTVGFYRRGQSRSAGLRGTRHANQRHRFLTIELSFAFLRRHLDEFVTSLHPLVREAVDAAANTSEIGPLMRLDSRHQQLLSSLRHPPVLELAQGAWYRAKALEAAAEFFFIARDNEELFCHRQKRLSAERVERVITVLKKDLAAPPSLEDIGRAVGCSAFHLSRTFSAATGMTIPQYLRQLRMERAAELLRSGKFNVTETALEVGYSSLSHFSHAFHETFGCCPGLYPMKTPAQKSRQP